MEAESARQVTQLTTQLNAQRDMQRMAMEQQSAADAQRCAAQSARL